MPMKIPLYSNETKGYGQVDLPADKYMFEVAEVPELSAASTSGRGKVTAKIEVADGKYKGKKLTVFWNLPQDSDPPDHFCRNFWKDINAVLPSLWDAKSEEFDERVLKGLKFHATVSYKEGNTYPQLNGYRWMGSSEQKSAAPSAGVEPQRPQTFRTPG